MPFKGDRGMPNGIQELRPLPGRDEGAVRAASNYTESEGHQGLDPAYTLLFEPHLLPCRHFHPS